MWVTCRSADERERSEPFFPVAPVACQPRFEAKGYRQITSIQPTGLGSA